MQTMGHSVLFKTGRVLANSIFLRGEILKQVSPHFLCIAFKKAETTSSKMLLNLRKNLP